MNTEHLPVYATPRMAAFLRGNAPWSGLVADAHIDLVELEPGREVALSPDLQITPIPVPHRDEYSDTVAYLVRGPKRSLFYCPDIDAFDVRRTFEQACLSASHIDVALLDGTFFSPAELPGRDLSQIPHPFVTDTVARFSVEGRSMTKGLLRTCISSISITAIPSGRMARSGRGWPSEDSRSGHSASAGNCELMAQQDFMRQTLIQLDS